MTTPDEQPPQPADLQVIQDRLQEFPEVKPLITIGSDGPVPEPDGTRVP